MNWKKLILSGVACTALFTACKDDEINTQLKSSTWVFNNVAHKTDYVSSGPGWLYAVEQKDGKIAEVEVNFYNNALPTSTGQYLVVRTPAQSNQLSIRTFENSSIDTTYFSTGDNGMDSAIVTFVDNKVRVTATDISMSSPKDSAQIRKLELNLQQR